jgi:hypothetical protein
MIMKPMERRNRRFNKPASAICDSGKIPMIMNKNIEPPIISQPAFIREMIIATGAEGGDWCGEFCAIYPGAQLPIAELSTDCTLSDDTLASLGEPFVT